MGDYNGRIGQVIRAFEKYPAGDLNTRMIVREALADERAEGFKAGYSEGVHDACQAQRSEGEAPWHENWEMAGRDLRGNPVLRYKPTGRLYNVLPAEETTP